MLDERQRRLVEDNMGLAWYTARMSSVPMELEEKISLCYLGLVLAAGSFDPDGGSGLRPLQSRSCRIRSYRDLNGRRNTLV